MQLDHMKYVTDQKCPKMAIVKCIVYYQDNHRRHTSLVSRQKLRSSRQEVLFHPSYILDGAQSGAYLFLSIANTLGVVKLAAKEACQSDWTSSTQTKRVLSEGRYYIVIV